MDYYIDAFRKYSDFEGRTTRKEFWMFVLINILIMILLSSISDLIGLERIIMWLYFLLTIIPIFAITVRRLHDIGKSWWWIFIQYVPIIWWIWLFILLILDSVGNNKYWLNRDD